MTAGIARVTGFSCDPTEFAGKRALVTGGSKGMGEAIVRRLTAAGAMMIIGDRSRRSASSHTPNVPTSVSTVKLAASRTRAVPGSRMSSVAVAALELSATLQLEPLAELQRDLLELKTEALDRFASGDLGDQAAISDLTTPINAARDHIGSLILVLQRDRPQMGPILDDILS
jgi:NAD(P)-dependent dehydrogenase (short-subunit alcohol dehydrogenase family)